MQLTHRPVQDKDIELVCSFPQNEEELFFLFPSAAFPLSEVRLREAIAQRADATVVDRDGEVIAFADFYRGGTGGNCAIGNVVVAPSARGCGVGSYLIRQMIALAFSKHQAKEVTVSCFNLNTMGLLFYPRFGFQPGAIEERRDKNGRRVALIHLRLSRPQDSSGL